MRVLVVDEMHDSIVPLLESIGCEIGYYPNADKNEASVLIKDFDGLLIRSKFFIDQSFLDVAPNLKFIGRAGAGLDLIDLEACKKLNIQVFAANEANRVAVAEQLLGMVLALFNNIIKSNEEIRNNQWLREANRGEELSGKTVGIIGFGNNGQESANRFSAFGCKVLAYDKYKSGFGNDKIKESSLNEIFEEADLVSFHVPLTSETRAWANEEFFNSFKNDIYFCNVARGEIMVQKDLLNAIKLGKVKGALLDVLENEKLAKLSESQREEFDFLKNHPRVIITPHVAGWTVESYEKINQVLVNKIRGFIEG